ncbi:MAG: hypothetical protein JW880_05175 [Candidatus Thermoplasmatota archaeon]|nr:hypothetical protein [Candidatus Thermoplasmatota archaeon]
MKLPKISKQQQIIILAAGAVTVVGVAVYLLFFNKPSTPPPSDQGLLRVETVPPSDVDVFVDGVLAGSWGVDWIPLAPGVYAVSFANPRGANVILPDPVDVTIKAGITTVVIACMSAGTASDGTVCDAGGTVTVKEYAV